MSISSNKDPRNEAARRHRGPAGWLAVVALALTGCASAPDAPEETGPPYELPTDPLLRVNG